MAAVNLIIHASEPPPLSPSGPHRVKKRDRSICYTHTKVGQGKVNFINSINGGGDTTDQIRYVA